MRQLKELEARVNDAPDSVLAVLTAADMPRWGEARVLYALLTVEAQDKSYIYILLISAPLPCALSYDFIGFFLTPSL